MRKSSSKFLALSLLSAALVAAPVIKAYAAGGDESEAAGNRYLYQGQEEGEQELEHRQPEIPRRLSHRLLRPSMITTTTPAPSTS